MKEVVVSNTMVLFEDCITNKENLKPYTEEYLQQHPDSVPTNFCNGVAKKFSYFELKLTIPRLIKIKQLLKMATKDTIFLFDQKYYRQVDGIAMGSPLGPVLANIFLSHHEGNWISSSNSNHK